MQNTTPAAETRPDWLTETPEGADFYALVMMDCRQADFRDTIEVSRGEYLRLKGCLAGLRGLSVPAVEGEDA